MAEATRTPRPDLLIIGDSHAIALQEGCAALGLQAGLLSFSGNLWHQNMIGLNRRNGIWVRGRGWQQRVTDLADRIGSANVLASGLPVIAAFGFHLGRLVPPFGAQGHTAGQAEFDAGAQASFVSSAMVAAYAAHYRQPMVRMLYRMSRMAPITVVAPPIVYDTANYRAFHGAVGGMITAAGLRLFDPMAALFPHEGVLPAEMRTPDGVHGSAAYGAKVIGALQQAGLVAPKQ